MQVKPLLVYAKDAKAILGVGTTKFYQLNKLENFPKPKYPNGKRPMYILSEIESWVVNLGN